MANLILNPSFEVDSNSDGLADNWATGHSVGGTVTASRVAGLFGSYAQRFAYTSASDSNKAIVMLSDMTAVGSVTPGGDCTGGAWVRLATAGAGYLAMVIYFYNAAGTYISNNSVTYPTPFTAGWRPVLMGATPPANASRVKLYIQVGGIDTGDTVTLDIDGVYLSADARFDHYGKYPVIGGSL